MKTPLTSCHPIALALVISALGGSFLLAQGPLTPPGAPAVTMKSLDQIEARTDVQKLAGDSTAQFIISQPGSYYLTANVTGVASKDGIRIAASGVTLDLNGFTMTGISTSRAGIYCAGGNVRVAIVNGTLTGWPLDGIDAGLSVSGRFEKLIATNNGSNATRAGIRTGSATVVRDCGASNNVGHGFRAGDACVFNSCSAYLNTGSGFALSNNDKVTDCIAQGNTLHGFDGANACVLTGCTATSNLTKGYNLSGEAGVLDQCSARSNTAIGIDGGDSAVLTNCASRSNGGDNIRTGSGSTLTKCSAIASIGGDGIDALFSVISQCTANSNNQHGINVSQRSRVSDCVTTGNSQSGVHATFAGVVERCLSNGNAFCGILADAGGFVDIVGNSCTENGGSNTGAGIRVSGASGHKIEGNNVGLNYRGIDVLSNRNMITRNIAVGNSNADYSIAGGNSQGPIVNVTGAGDISGTAGANHPAANFQY